MRIIQFTLAALYLFWQFPAGAIAEPTIIEWPIPFNGQRIELTRRYIKSHYGLDVKNIRIKPKAIVIHHTALNDLKMAYLGFKQARIYGNRSKTLIRGGALNVSAHFLVARDGTIFRLMPEDWMARHCIGLNYDAIGIENVGGEPNDPLTPKQLEANTSLVRYLYHKYPIRYLLGHMEVATFEAAPFFRELDPTYRTLKADPGNAFMAKLRSRLKKLDLLGTYTIPPANKSVWAGLKTNAADQKEHPAR